MGMDRFRHHERHGLHRWTGWSNYRAVMPKPMVVSIDDTVTLNTPLEAFRWRGCECGAEERQSYANGEVERFPPDRR